MPYNFLDNIATADVAFRAWGGSLEETFQSAAAATLAVMLENPESLEPRQTLTIDLRDDSEEMLLFNLLQELLWYKDARQLFLKITDLHFGKTADQVTLTAAAAGEPIDPARHHLGTDVKAVTLHLFRLEKTPTGWESQIILDI